MLPMNMAFASLGKVEDACREALVETFSSLVIATGSSFSATSFEISFDGLLSSLDRYSTIFCPEIFPSGSTGHGTCSNVGFCLDSARLILLPSSSNTPWGPFASIMQSYSSCRDFHILGDLKAVIPVRLDLHQQVFGVKLYSPPDGEWH